MKYNKKKIAIDGLPTLYEVIKKYNLIAKKSLGQNFFYDFNIILKIVNYVGNINNITILEIGPGLGSLTRALLMNNPKKVISIEIDHRMKDALIEISNHYSGKLEIIFDNALTINIQNKLNGRVKIIANLPYNIATKLLLKWLEYNPWPPWYESITLMLQKEIVERIIARPNTKAYGRLSVICQCRCEVKLAFTVSKFNFIPRPKVTSAIVHIIPKLSVLNVYSLRSLSIITSAAFNQRRKMLHTSLKKILPNSINFLIKLGIDSSLRADALSVQDYIKIAKAYKNNKI